MVCDCDTPWTFLIPFFKRRRHSKQDGGCGGHLGFPIGTDFFDLAVNCFHNVFQLKLPKVSGEKSKIGFQDGGYGSHFGFPNDIILALFRLHDNLLLHCKFPLVVCVKMSKTDGGCGGHFGCPIDTIFAHFDQTVALLI